MEFIQTKDILQKATDFHQRLSEYYRAERERLDGERVKLVLTYLSRHEKNLAGILRRCEENTSPAVINTWFKFTPDSITNLMAKDYHIPAGSNTDDVIQLALDLDNHLIEFYSDAAQRAMSQEVKELFENLRAQEEQEEHRLARITLSDF